MKKSREFENIFDECLERLLVYDATIEDCLQSFPQYASELEPLLKTALAAGKAAAIQPRPEFMDRARYQFYSALRVMEPEKSRPVFHWPLRWATTVVSIALAILLAGGGTVAAASSSMPDEPLYPVKLATEQVQVILTPTRLGKVELYTKLADKRVLEIARMANENNPEQIELTVQRLDTHLTRIAALASTQEAGESAMLASPQATPATKEALTTAEAPVAQEAQDTAKAPAAVEAPGLEEAPPPRAVLPSPPGPPESKKAKSQVEHKAKIKTTVTNQASNNIARLQALLETVPESAKPALLHAIAVSEAGYQEAIESLDQP